MEIYARFRDGFRPGIVEQWLKSFITQLNNLNWPSMFEKALGIAFKVLLAGFAIGFAFINFVILEGTYPGIGISTWGTALVLWISLEYLYSDPVFVFAGSVYLYLVAAIGTAAITAQLPLDLVVSSSLQQPSWYLVGILAAFSVFKWVWKATVNSIVRTALYGKKTTNNAGNSRNKPGPASIRKDGFQQKKLWLGK